MRLKKETGTALIITAVALFILSISIFAIHVQSKRILKSKIESYAGKNLSIESVSSNFREITLSNVALRDKRGREIGKAEKVTIRPSILEILKKEYSISEIRIVKPYLLIETDRKGKPLFVFPIKSEKIEDRPTQRKEKREKISLNVEKTEIVNGSIDYVDRGTESLSAAFKIRNLNMVIKNLSHPLERGAILFDFQAEIPGYESTAKLAGSGKINLANKDTDSTLKIRDLDIKILEPYLKKTRDDLKIEKGLIDLEMRITVFAKKLNAPCKVIIRDLKIGHTSRIGSRFLEETLKRALFILKDKKGDVVFDFVVSGNLDDPDFDLKRAIKQGILKAIAEKVGIFFLGGFQISATPNL